MRRKTLRNATASVIGILLILVFFWVLGRTFSSPDSEAGHVHALAMESPDFERDIQPIFNRSCATGGCHDRTAMAGLSLDRGEAHSRLVGVGSALEPDKKRVVPGDAGKSYIIMKLEGTQSVGGRMPQGREPLPDELIQAIRKWIDQGAEK